MTLLLILVVHFCIFVPLGIRNSSVDPALTRNGCLLCRAFSSVSHFSVVVFDGRSKRALVGEIVKLPNSSVSCDRSRLCLGKRIVRRPFLKARRRRKVSIFASSFSLLSLAKIRVIPRGDCFILKSGQIHDQSDQVFNFIPRTSVTKGTTVICFPFRSFNFVRGWRPAKFVEGNSSVSFKGGGRSCRSSNFISEGREFKIRRGGSVRPRGQNNFFQRTLDLLLSITVTFILFIIVQACLFCPFRIINSSVMPALRAKSQLVLGGLTRISHFSVIIFPTPSKASRRCIGHIVKLPNSRVACFRSRLCVGNRGMARRCLRTLGRKSGRALANSFALFDLAKRVTIPRSVCFILKSGHIISGSDHIFKFVPTTRVRKATSLEL